LPQRKNTYLTSGQGVRSAQFGGLHKTAGMDNSSSMGRDVEELPSSKRYAATLPEELSTFLINDH